MDRRGGWADVGSGSCAEWLAWRCAVSPRAAREHVRVARRLPELPLIHAAFARGELSYAKVRALTRVATLASHIYAGTCRWLELVGEVDRRGAWTEAGSGSCAEWFAWQRRRRSSSGRSGRTGA